MAEFLSCHAASVEAVNAAPADWAQAVVDAGIVDNATIAEKAIPGCMLVCQTGKDMKAALGGYLQVLADADAVPWAVSSRLTILLHGVARACVCSTHD